MNESEARERIRQMISFVQEEAKEKAIEIRGKAENDYNAAKTKHLHQAKAKLEEEYQKKWKSIEVNRRIERSAAINRARMDIMQIKNECIDELLQETRLAVAEKARRDPDAYKLTLKNLIIQGLIKLLESDVKIRARKEDSELVQSVLEAAAREFKEIMQKEAHQRYDVTLSLDSKYLDPRPVVGSNAPSCCGGVVLLADEGRIKCTNTMDERLSAMFSNTVPSLRKMLFNS
jgi:V-type H+-transporting ATPase subunit E